MPTATIHQSGLRIVIPTPQARSHQNQRRADRRSSEPTQAHAPPRGSTSGHGIRFSMDQLQSRAVKAAAAPHLAREHAPTNWPSTGTRIREACAATQEPPTHENVDRAGFRHQRVRGPGRNGLGSAPRAGAQKNCAGPAVGRGYERPPPTARPPADFCVRPKARMHRPCSLLRPTTIARSAVDRTASRIPRSARGRLSPTRPSRSPVAASARTRCHKKARGKNGSGAASAAVCGQAPGSPFPPNLPADPTSHPRRARSTELGCPLPYARSGRGFRDSLEPGT